MITRASGRQVLTKWIFIISGLCTFMFVIGCSTPRGNANPVSYYQLSGGTKAGTFSIERVELGYAKGGSSITVQKGQKITPTAYIKFYGSGVLSASWLVDEVVLEQVNISLTHGSLLTLSPKAFTQIPTFVSGHHSLRLQINRPQIDFTQPKLSYFVVVH